MQHGAIGRELLDISVRNLFDSARRDAVGLEVGNQYLIFGHRKTVDLTDPKVNAELETYQSLIQQGRGKEVL